MKEAEFIRKRQHLEECKELYGSDEYETQVKQLEEEYVNGNK